MPCCKGFVCGVDDNWQPACQANDPPLGQCYNDGDLCTGDYQCCGFNCNTGKGKFFCGDGNVATEAPTTTSSTTTTTEVAITDACLSRPRTLCAAAGANCCSNLVCTPVGSKNTLRCEVPTPEPGACYDAPQKCSRDTHCCSGDCNLRAFKCRATTTTTTTTTELATTEGNCQSEVFGSCLALACCSGMVCGVGTDGQPACLVNDPPFGQCYDADQTCSQFYQCCSFACDTNSYKCQASTGQLLNGGDDDGPFYGGRTALIDRSSASSEANAGTDPEKKTATEYMALGMASCAVLALIVGIFAVRSRKTHQSRNAIAMLSGKFGARDKLNYSFDTDAADGLTYDDYEMRAQMLAGNGVGSTTSTISSTSSTGHYYDTKIPLYDLAMPSSTQGKSKVDGFGFGRASTNRYGSRGSSYRDQLGSDSRGGSSVSLASSSTFSPDRVAYL